MPEPRARAEGDPLAPASARVTYRLEWRLSVLCQLMTQMATAEILRLPTSTLSNLCCIGSSRGYAAGTLSGV